MKKLVLVLGLAILFSCEKENQSCGLIIDDNVKDYSITIRKPNGNIETHVLYHGDWVNAHVGSEICIQKY